jgi:replicative DNA helicase
VGIADDEESKAQEYVAKIRKLVGTDVRCPADIKHVAGQVVEFCRYQAMLAAIKKNIERLKEGKSLDLAVCENAMQIGQDLHNMGVLLSGSDPDLAMDVIDRVTKRGYGVRTGYSFLDNIWKNGWAPGWLIVPLAPPKRFKTTFCINLALNIAGPSIGEDVLYYTCEISDDLAAVRAMCNVSRVPMDVMYESPEKFKIQVRDQMKMLLHGEVLVKGFASKTATIADLKAHAKMAIQQGLRPKAIIIDYADTVKPSSTHKEKKDHLLQADVYTEARAMGSELGCCVIMPDRCTRDTVSLPVPSMQSFQGAFEKAGIVDIAIGLCATEAELKNNVIRLFVFLNRHGPALQHFQGAVDASAYRMEILKELEYDPDDTGTDSKGKGKGKDKKGVSHLPDDLEE